MENTLAVLMRFIEESDWLLLENVVGDREYLEIEPAGKHWEMMTGERFLVCLLEREPNKPKIHVSEHVVQVFASHAVVYRGDEKLWDEFDLNPSLPGDV